MNYRGYFIIEDTDGFYWEDADSVVYGDFFKTAAECQQDIDAHIEMLARQSVEMFGVQPVGSAP